MGINNVISLVAMLIAVLGVAHAAEESANLRAVIMESVGAESEMETGGIFNCYLKCQRLFDTTAYLINANTEHTFEFRACLYGCNRCDAELAKKKNRNPTDCMTYCKNYNFLGDGILKGKRIDDSRICPH